MNERDVTPTAEIRATTHAILESVVEGGEGRVLDDNDLLPVLRRVVRGMRRLLEATGVEREAVEASAEEVMEAAREAYVALWIRQAYEIEDGPVDEAAERRRALQAFALAERGER